MLKDLILGKCGDNCYYCHRYIATKNGSIEALEKVKELWIRLGLRDPDFPVQDMACEGCKPENKCAYTELCACVRKKRIENCGFCNEYPCGLMNDAFDKSEDLRIKAIHVCTKEEIDLLNKAFFSKREYFNNIHQKHQKN